MKTMQEIQQLADIFAHARAELKVHVTHLEAEYAEAKKFGLPQIKMALDVASRAEADLREAVSESQGLFKSPKSHIFHDIKVGWAKGAGKVTFADAAQVVKRIRKLFPKKVRVYIKVKETPDKKALLKLKVEQLEKLGCSVVGAGDAVVVKPVDGEIDKLVDALLGKATDEQEDAE